jgi:ferric-dicitrate binding protein FerR (iron transport regulator)
LTSVRLYEGKVVIKKEGASSRQFKEVFLKPGQELNFNNTDFSYQLTSIDKTAPQQNLPKAAKAQSKSAPALLNFDNQPLSDIFNQLQKQYNIKIIFKTGTLEDLRFTGTHNPASESLEDFLNTIAILNDLKVEKKPNAFIITPN